MKGLKPFPKGQHTYPQFNLKYFTEDDGYLWVYDSHKNVFRRQNLKDTAKVTNFYSFTNDKGEKLPDIEEALSQIEGGAAGVLEKIDRGDFRFTDEERTYMAYHIALQHHRTPLYREQTNLMMEHMTKEMMKFSASNRDYFSKTLIRALGGKPEEKGYSVDELQKYIFSEDYKIQFPQEMSLQIMMGNLSHFANYFFNMPWTFLTAPKDGMFLTSDAPFSMIQTNPENKLFGKPMVGYAVRGTEITLPLTPKICLYLSPERTKEGKYEISRDLVRVINYRTTMGCFRFVYSQNEALIRRLIKSTKLNNFRPLKMNAN